MMHKVLKAFYGSEELPKTDVLIRISSSSEGILWLVMGMEHALFLFYGSAIENIKKSH